MKIDLCVFLAGNHLNEYVPLFIETLARNCNISLLNIHVVEKGWFRAPATDEERNEFIKDQSPPWYIDLRMKYYMPGVGENVHKYLLKKKEEFLVPFNIYEMHDASLFFKKSTPREPFYCMAADHAETCDWAMANCGNEKWVILCHLDMIFRKDIVSRLAIEMNDFTGMYGIFNHCFAINRDAFFRVGVGFKDASGFKVFKSTKNGYDFEMSHANDPFCPKDSWVMNGFDVGELLKVMMIENGWRCLYRNDNAELQAYVDHMCSGHGYVCEEVEASHRDRRSGWLSEYGVEKL